MQVREMRLERGWSQEQLAERTGLSVRTIQRIEGGHSIGLASASALARAFGIETADVTGPVSPQPVPTDFVGSVRTCLVSFADFTGRAPRPQYWWFALFVLLVVAAATALSEPLGAAVSIVFVLPLISAGARRLHDTGRSGWWQLFALAPFGFVIPMILLAGPTVTDTADVAR